MSTCRWKDVLARLHREDTLLLRDIHPSGPTGVVSMTYGEPTLPALVILAARCADLVPDFTFEDVGSGFGKVVFFMALHGARWARGVEVNDVRHAVAVEIAASFPGVPTSFVLGEAGDTRPSRVDIAYSYDLVFTDSSLMKIAAAYRGRTRFFIHCARRDKIFFDAGFVRVSAFPLSTGQTGRFMFSILSNPDN